MNKLAMVMVLAFHPLLLLQSLSAESDATLLISEVQTEGTSARDELIEIHNPGTDFFALSGYEIVYISSSGATTTKQVDLSGYLAPGAYIYYVHPDFPDANASGFLQASGMATSGGHVVIRHEVSMLELDRLGWGSATSPEGNPASPHNPSESLQRIDFEETLSSEETDETIDEEAPLIEETTEEDELEIKTPKSSLYTEDELGSLIDTDDNLNDFVSRIPSPENTNSDPPEDYFENIDEGGEPDEDTPEEITVDPDAYFTGFSPVLVSELLADPASPVTDAEGEYVELFNPNDVDVDLTGVTLQMGSTFSRKLPLDNITIKPGEFLTIYSSQANISLGNSGSSIRMVLPSGGVWGPVVSYGKVKAGESYSLFDGVWRFTIVQTPGNANVYRAPVTAVKRASTSKKSTTRKTSSYVDPKKFNLFKPVIISELLPNPAPPSNDREAEYVEIYNPNDSVVELYGLIIQTGSNFSYSHTFEKGDRLGPGEYMALFSKDTNLTLANSGGAARVLLPNGEQWGEAVVYDEADDGEAYALIDGAWQWTKELTPAAVNKMDNSIQESDSETSEAGLYSEVYQEPPEIPSTARSWVMVGGLVLSTLLYSGYEYRKDLANKLWQYRRNRSLSSKAS